MKPVSNWKQEIKGLWADSEFFPPADPREIQQLEVHYRLQLPEELKEFLAQTDGFSASYATYYIFRTAPEADEFDTFKYHNETMRNTLDFKDLYAPFEDIFFFGADGGGDLFGYKIIEGRCSNQIVRWNHEDDSRITISDDGLSKYFHYVSRMDSN
jgi:hypothetical protein